jgi:hypothetical protein
MNQQLTSWGASLMASLSSALTLLFAAVPRIIGFLVILGVGWLLAALVERVVVGVLRAVHVDRFAERAGMAKAVQALRHEPSAILGLLVKWFVRLIALDVAFDALGVPAVSEVLHAFVLWLPNLAVAMVVLVLGGLAANAVGDMVRAGSARAGVDRPELPGAAARWAIWAFAVIVAVNQIGVASVLVDILFTAVVGALALALGLSFGLGARDTAGSIVRDLYTRNLARNSRPMDQALAAAHQSGNVNFNGIEQRRALADRRGNGRQAS